MEVITINCTKCKKRDSVNFQEHYPKNTNTVIVGFCKNCRENGDFYHEIYLDKNKKVII